jgi:hypothetical protein
MATARRKCVTIHISEGHDPGVFRDRNKMNQRQAQDEPQTQSEVRYRHMMSQIQAQDVFRHRHNARSEIGIR